jgi:hypothetical protein
VRESPTFASAADELSLQPTKMSAVAVGPTFWSAQACSPTFSSTP